MNEYKKVTYKHLKKGQVIKGTELGSMHSGFTAYVKDINASFVTVEMWNRGGREEKIDSESMFLIEMSDEEIREKYNDKAAKIVKSIQTSLLCDEIGCHDMCNSWLSSDPWELTQACVKKKLTMIGHCKDITPKTSWLTGDKLDVGICVEDEDGDRFWCHFRYKDVLVLARRYERYQEWKAKGKSGDIEDILFCVPIDIEKEK